MFREVWGEETSKIYEEVLSECFLDVMVVSSPNCVFVSVQNNLSRCLDTRPRQIGTLRLGGGKSIFDRRVPFRASLEQTEQVPCFTRFLGRVTAFSTLLPKHTLINHSIHCSPDLPIITPLMLSNNTTSFDFTPPSFLHSRPQVSLSGERPDCGEYVPSIRAQLERYKALQPRGLGHAEWNRNHLHIAHKAYFPRFPLLLVTVIISTLF